MHVDLELLISSQDAILSLSKCRLSNDHIQSVLLESRGPPVSIAKDSDKLILTKEFADDRLSLEEFLILELSLSATLRH